MEQKDIAKLVEKLQNGDKQAFERLYQETSKTVYFICISFLNNEEDARDVMQDTYITAYQKLEQLQDKEKFVAWISQIAVNKCKKLLLKNSPVLMEPESMTDMATEKNESFLPEEYITQKSKRKIVMDIMRKKLSDIQYQTVILFYFNDLSIEEIADIMECPPGTVKYRLSVSRAKIKEGVLEYENESKDKLYSFAPIPFLAGLLAMEAENIEAPDVWGSIMQNLDVLHGGIVAGATHTVEKGVEQSIKSAVGGEAVKEAVAGTMKGSGVVKNIGKIVLELFKKKLVMGIVGLVAVAGITIAVLNVINHNTEEDNTKIIQSDVTETEVPSNEGGNEDEASTDDSGNEEVASTDDSGNQADELVSNVDEALLADGVTEEEWALILKNDVDITSLEYCLGIMTKCKLDNHENYVAEALIDLDANIYFKEPFDLIGNFQEADFNYEWFSVYYVSELNKVYGLMPNGTINESNIPEDAHIKGIYLYVNLNAPDEYCITEGVDLDGLTNYLVANYYLPCPMSVAIENVDTSQTNKIIVEYSYALNDEDGNVIHEKSPFVAYLEPDESGRYVITSIEKSN